jgi:hypothetical protein
MMMLSRYVALLEIVRADARQNTITKQRRMMRETSCIFLLCAGKQFGPKSVRRRIESFGKIKLKFEPKESQIVLFLRKKN